MDKNYYPEYYVLERTHWWFLARLKIIESQISATFPGSNDLRILNVGAATGATSEMLGKFGQVVSIEYEADCIAFTKDKLSIPIEEGSILDIQYPENTFDLVCAFDVVEHVENDALAVQEMFRVCKPGGAVFVTVPAFMGLWSHHDVINHHFKRYTKKDILPLGNSIGQLAFFSYFNSILFLPIYLLRQITNILPKMIAREGSGSDFGLVKSQGINAVFYRLFLAENFWLRKRISMPFGVSAMAVWQKKQD